VLQKIPGIPERPVRAIEWCDFAIWMRRTSGVNTEYCIHICDALLRDEQAAVATDSKVIIAFEEKEMRPELHGILDDHREPVLALTENVRSMGGEPSSDSDTWDAFALSEQAAADFIGDKSAITSLQNGENAGRHYYKSALEPV
jgi:hypothetical protein